MGEMLKKLTVVFIAVILTVPLLAGCGDPPVPSFEGEFDVPYSLGEKFTINAIGVSDNLRRYKWVVVDVILEVNDTSIIPTFDDRNHRIREIVTDAIKARTLDQLNELAEKDKLRQEIKEKTNNEFNTSAVQRVVFGDFYFA
jgi:flagellar basal body-associated protein FliL